MTRKSTKSTPVPPLRRKKRIQFSVDQLLTTSSSFSKVQRTLAYILRFAQNARRTNVKSKGAITAQELQMSEKYLFKCCQDSIDLSRFEDKLLPKTDQDGLQRAHGRLEYIRSLPKEIRNPIILPHNHPLVKLLLQHLHDQRRHCGYKSLMREARQRFWIAGLRGMCKQLTRRCVTCRAKSYVVELWAKSQVVESRQDCHHFLIQPWTCLDRYRSG